MHSWLTPRSRAPITRQSTIKHIENNMTPGFGFSGATNWHTEAAPSTRAGARGDTVLFNGCLTCSCKPLLGPRAWTTQVRKPHPCAALVLPSWRMFLGPALAAMYRRWDKLARRNTASVSCGRWEAKQASSKSLKTPSTFPWRWRRQLPVSSFRSSAPRLLRVLGNTSSAVSLPCASCMRIASSLIAGRISLEIEGGHGRGGRSVANESFFGSLCPAPRCCCLCARPCNHPLLVILAASISSPRLCLWTGGGPGSVSEEGWCFAFFQSLRSQLANSRRATYVQQQTTWTLLVGLLSKQQRLVVCTSLLHTATV